MIGGQLAPDAGRVLLAGEVIDRPAAAPHLAAGVGRTFQVARRFSTVAENVQMALLSLHGRTRAWWPDMRELYREEAVALLDRVGMADNADRPCSELAYGDVKRVELAIALAGAPKLLLMDEPTAGMAPKERAQLMELVAGIARERQIGVLFTEHDMDSVFGHADRVLVLVRGEIVAPACRTRCAPIPRCARSTWAGRARPHCIRPPGERHGRRAITGGRGPERRLRPGADPVRRVA